MQQDTKWMVGSGIATVVFMFLNSIFPALRVLVLLILFIFLLAVTFWAARPRSEE